MKYSFIVPVYGCEAYLEACVDSILAQKGSHSFEIILVDDGARDSSGEIADRLSRQHACVRTFHKENGGAASARNYGLRQAEGDYILFIDGDDTVEDGLLNAAETALEADPEAMLIYGMSFDYYRKGQLVRTEKLSCNHSGEYLTAELAADFASFFYDNALSSACNKVFPKALLFRNDLQAREGMRLYEDFEFVLRCLNHVKRVVCLPHAYYHYRNDLQQNHLGSRVEDLEKLQSDMVLLLESAAELGYETTQAAEVAANLYMQLLWQHLMNRRYTPAQMAQPLLAYIREPAFCALLAAEAKLGAQEESLRYRIETGEFSSICGEIQKRKRIARIKRSIKAILRVLGLRKA